MGISVVILTFNSSDTIGGTLASALTVSDDVHVVDSGSDDSTIDIATSAGAHVWKHPFTHYGAQRNWAMDALPLKHEWELHLDADERLTPRLCAELERIQADNPPHVEGYYIPRLVYFLGQPIRHGGMYPIWHLRLFRRGKGRCEDRRYDQHFYVNGPTMRLEAPMIDDIRMSLTEWIARHNRWADSEIEEFAMPSGGVIEGQWLGNPVQRKRALRGQYDRLPLLLRPFLLFFYRYILRCGFLDGRAGLIFFVLQTFWFRFLIDAKLVERNLRGSYQ